ncbi:TDT family transporter [Proteinivorax hydrogeniformans]|uniref:TDT family transporter n=1 Tax=Proteinivorax hydrogeniformans TaxID=1826727 RepID=A0AAU8HT00_9FIRM
MSDIIKKLPYPIAGLMLACATLGNLLASYGEIYRYFFGAISACILVLIVAKLIIMPKSLMAAFENPVLASVLPTFSMGLMVLSTYISSFNFLASMLWFFAILIHLLLIFVFTKKYIFNFNIKAVFPSYFVVYVVIVVASISAPALGHQNIGQYLFWFGLLSYLILLPIVLYRVVKIKSMPPPALPTFVILTAPASLCLAGYISSFPHPNNVLISFLAGLAFVMLGAVATKMPPLLKSEFYPSYSAFTFPFVITAVAFKGLAAMSGFYGLIIFAMVLEVWAALIVIYVLCRYMMYLLSIEFPIVKSKKNQAS